MMMKSRKVVTAMPGSDDVGPGSAFTSRSSRTSRKFRRVDNTIRTANLPFLVQLRTTMLLITRVRRGQRSYLEGRSRMRSGPEDDSRCLAWFSRLLRLSSVRRMLLAPLRTQSSSA